jgi:hypothetical protein
MVVTFVWLVFAQRQQKKETVLMTCGSILKLMWRCILLTRSRSWSCLILRGGTIVWPLSSGDRGRATATALVPQRQHNATRRRHELPSQILDIKLVRADQ